MRKVARYSMAPYLSVPTYRQHQEWLGNERFYQAMWKCWEQGDVKGAYRLAAAHSAESPADAADAEFHAGWYALRGLGDAKTGARHFARIAAIADGPISLARAYYWLGRAAEAGGPGNAQAYYLKAAGYVVEEIAPPDMERGVELWHMICVTDVFAGLCGVVFLALDSVGLLVSTIAERSWASLSFPRHATALFLLLLLFLS